MKIRFVSLVMASALSGIVFSAEPARADNFTFSFTGDLNPGSGYTTYDGPITGEIIGLPANCTACAPQEVIIDSAPPVFLNAATPAFPMDASLWPCNADLPTSCGPPNFAFNVVNDVITNSSGGAFWSTVPPEPNRPYVEYEEFGFGFNPALGNVSLLELFDTGGNNQVIQGTVTFSSEAPEPASISLMLSGFAWFIRKRIQRY